MNSDGTGETKQAASDKGALFLPAIFIHHAADNFLQIIPGLESNFPANAREVGNAPRQVIEGEAVGRLVRDVANLAFRSRVRPLRPSAAVPAAVPGAGKACRPRPAASARSGASIAPKSRKKGVPSHADLS